MGGRSPAVGDAACVAFLQEALPRLGLRWAGFRKPRRQVCRRLGRRLAELGLEDLEAYRARLAAEPGEWAVLDALCRVTISRFLRDRRVWEVLGEEVLPALGRHAGDVPLRVWSAGCASGEEPYSVALVWELQVAGRAPAASLEVLGTDVDPVLLERARRAVYAPGTLKEVPPAWREAAFEPVKGAEPALQLLRLRPAFRAPVRFTLHDVRDAPPGGPFDVLLCRYLAFTYFDAATAGRVAAGLGRVLRPGGALVLGSTDRLPPALEAWPAHPRSPLVRIRPANAR